MEFDDGSVRQQFGSGNVTGESGPHVKCLCLIVIVFNSGQVGLFETISQEL